MWILPLCVVVPLSMGGSGYIVLILVYAVGGCHQASMRDLTEVSYSFAEGCANGVGHAGRT